MAEQDWLKPASVPAPSPYQNVIEGASAGAPAYDLRPLNLGELLDRTFSLYRSRFWLFAGIAAVGGAVSLVINVVQAVLRHFFFFKSSASPFSAMTSGAVSLLVLVIYFLAFSVTQAATVFALGEVYLGKVATIGSSLRATISRWYVYMAIAVWQWCSLIWVPLLFMVPAFAGMAFLAVKAPGLAIVSGILIFLGVTAGLAIGFILFLRNGLATQATVIERLDIRASMRRSKNLSQGAKGRMFVVLLISAAMYLVVGVAQLPLVFVIAAAIKRGSEAIGAQAAMFLIAFLASTLVTPVALIGLSLVYFDQRVRKEAFDIAVLLGEPQTQGFPAAAGGGFAAPAREAWESETRAGDDSTV